MSTRGVADARDDLTVAGLAVPEAHQLHDGEVVGEVTPVLGDLAHGRCHPSQRQGENVPEPPDISARLMSTTL